MKMLTKIRSVLSALLTPGEPLLVGVSGGADSVALLHSLIQLGSKDSGQGWRLHVCHLNHQLRGADSDADAEFVRQLAQRHGLPFTIEKRDVATLAADRKLSLEDAARRARHKFLAAVAEQTGIKTLALAHTADDQVETFLLKLLRGAGATGLSGMELERQLGGMRVIRPLLGVRRNEILDYLATEKVSWREDASNADPRFTRNRIRHVLLPLLEREFNPAVRETLLRTVEILRDEDSYLTHHVSNAVYSPACSGDEIDIEALAGWPPAVQRRVVRLWLGSETEFGFEHIEAVRELAVSDSPSAEVHLPEDLIVYREYDELKKVRREELEPVRGKWPLAISGETVIRELGVKFICHPEPIEGSRSLPKEILRSAQNDKKSEESLDLGSLGDSPFIRTWQEGDRFQPLGMSGEKKLQDFFVDEKVPRRVRGRTPLLCAADGRISWVVGVRIADPFKIGKNTRRILRMRVKPL
jgi:tRNA(Ile)-lysidine synthase